MSMNPHVSQALVLVFVVSLLAVFPGSTFAQDQAAQAVQANTQADLGLQTAQVQRQTAQVQLQTAQDQQQRVAIIMKNTQLDTGSRKKFTDSSARGWLWVQSQCTDTTVSHQCAAAAIMMASNQCSASARFLRKDAKSWQYLSFGMLLASAGFTGAGAAATIAGSSTVPKVFSTLGGATGIGAVTSSVNANVTSDQAGLTAISTILNQLITYVTTGAAKGAAAVPTIANGLSASGTINTAFSYQIVATNSPTSFLVTGLPAGLSASASTGLISGTPTAAGTTTVTLAATNASGTSSNANLTLNIAANAPTAAPAINSAGSASGTVGSPFGYQISASNSANNYSVAAGSTLPAGLSLNATTGLISGSPTATGTTPVTLTASNAVGTSASFTLTFTIASAPPAGNGPAPNELVYEVASAYGAQCSAVALSSPNAPSK
jgi:hypothetical protein